MLISLLLDNLFNLENDPDETTNLATDEQYQSVMKDMIARLNRWKKQVGDQGMKTELEALEMFPREFGHQD